MSSSRLRLWPGVVAVTLQWLLWFGLPAVAPDIGILGLMGGMACALIVILWWLFFSRAPWLERIGVLALMAVAVVVVRPIIDFSILNGAMGRLQPILSVPPLCLALVAGLVATRNSSTAMRRAVTAVALLLGTASVGLLRTDGMTGDGLAQLNWRWVPTAEQRLLAQSATETETPTPAPIATNAPATPTDTAPAPAAPGAAAKSDASTPAPPVATAEAPLAEWPGFRGASRDDVIHGVKVETDWSTKPPVEIWRKPIGPGWSSFAVQGNLIYTQEQRGEEEVVSSYNLDNGSLVWRHKDRVRFYESNGGAGPRGTPAVAHGRVYSLGAKGALNALDARTGAVVWSRNAVADTGATIPGWGIAGSPLVLGETIVVATGGRLAAYDAATGKPRWMGPSRGSGYGSPHLATIAGVPQILLQSSVGITGVSPADGALLWQHDWAGAAMLQPAVTADGDVLVTTGDMMGGVGTRRLSVSLAGGTWTVAERWTSRGLKPYFSDIVVRSGHAYGFDGAILSCIDLKDGVRKWKGGRYGTGQLVLLADQDLLLVLSEEGEIALVKATPDQFTELGRVPAIDGKTWNHLVVVGDRVLVRNGEEMAAFRLPIAGR